MRSNVWTVAAALGLLVCSTVSSQAAEPDNGGVEVVKVRSNVYMIAGAGGNIGVQIGSDGIILVNSGNGAATTEVLAALKKLTDSQIRYIINTDAGADFVGGNAKLAKVGLNVLNGQTGAAILAHESVLARMSARNAKPSYPGDAWPSEAFLPKRYAFRMNDDAIEIFHQPAAHSDADSLVLFRQADVVVAGDILDTTRFPVIDVANGGTVQGEIDALNRLIELTVVPIPFIYNGAGTSVIPGHGRVCQQLDVVDYRDMVVEVRDVIADLIKQGKTLDQIKEAHPARPYETEYGTQEGATSAFVESIYKSLSAKK
jgi:glyoxylase-like metal-dependent hydrolase (beta-lactamase superfamily II)